MSFLDDGTDEEVYEHSNRTVLDGNVMNMCLIVMEVKCGAIDADYSSCNGYYIIKFSLSPYALQADFSIDGKVIYYSEILCAPVSTSLLHQIMGVMISENMA